MKVYMMPQETYQDEYSNTDPSPKYPDLRSVAEVPGHIYERLEQAEEELRAARCALGAYFKGVARG